MTNRSKPVFGERPATEIVMVSFCEPRTMVTEPCAFGRQVTPGVLTIVKWKPLAGLALPDRAACAAVSETASAAAAPTTATVRPVRPRAAPAILEKCDETDLSILITFRSRAT